MIKLKLETVHNFKKLYESYSELINYRIRHGNLYEQSQATLIKNVALGVSQIPETAQQSASLQNNVEGNSDGI